jgi:hypothetical protein
MRSVSSTGAKGRKVKLSVTGITEAIDLEIRNANQSVTALAQVNKPLLLNVEQLTIENDDQQKNAEKLYGLVNDAVKEVNEKRIRDGRTLYDGYKAVNDTYRDITDLLKDASIKIKNALKAYQVKKVTAAAEKEAELKANAPAGISPDQITVSAPPKTSKTNMGGTQYRDHWRVIEVDMDLLPNEYKLPNYELLTKAVNENKGKILIPGVTVEYDPIVASTK